MVVPSSTSIFFPSIVTIDHGLPPQFDLRPPPNAQTSIAGAALDALVLVDDVGPLFPPVMASEAQLRRQTSQPLHFSRQVSGSMV